MSRDDRDDLQDRLDDLEDTMTDDEMTIHSTTVTITPEMVDENGGTINSKVPDAPTPDGYELGDVLPTESPLLTAHELIPVEEES